MSISWLKFSKDKKTFKLFESLGMDVYEIDDLERTDEKIKELLNQKYTTIVLSNEVASFSQDIITKYSKNKDINIIISNK
jgi:vacuolar-type H+-ATPase subunit F/Vma7